MVDTLKRSWRRECRVEGDALHHRRVKGGTVGKVDHPSDSP